jgi:hypothetical protein
VTFQKSKTNVPTAPAPAAAAPWTFRPLAHLLPGGLPTGALTLVNLPDQAVRRGPWSTVVGQLLLDTLDRCQPAVYTYADEPYACWPEEGLNPLGPHYLTVPDWCGCCDSRGHFAGVHASTPPTGRTLSTLDNIKSALAEHERWHGPSLVLIDHLEHARPYAYLPGGMFHAGGRRDGSGDSPRAHLARRRAADLLGFAADRPDAPTVVTWTQGPVGTPDDALSHVAEVVIDPLPCERNYPVNVRVQTRRSLDHPWPAPTAAVLPWFDWGFDDRDLDAEDA